MHFASRAWLAAALAILISTAACGSDNSTGPAPKTILANRFDTLYLAAKATSTTDSNFDFRTSALSDLELPAAFGGTPTNISVTTANGTESWKGFIFEEVMTNGGTPVDSGRLFLAYRDADAHTLIATVILANGSFVSSALMANDTVIVHASATSGSITQTATGGSCPTAPSGLSNPVIATASQATCLLATYSATLSFSFPAASGVDAALTQLSFPLTTFNGVRFQDPFGSSTTRIVWQNALFRSN